MVNALFWMFWGLNVRIGSCMNGFMVTIKKEFFMFSKVSCRCLFVRGSVFVLACEWIGFLASGAFENLKVGATRLTCSAWRWWILWLTHIKADHDWLIFFYCALWLNERWHDYGRLPLWHVFIEMCYLIKCSLKLVDRNVLNRAQITSPTIRHR